MMATAGRRRVLDRQVAEAAKRRQCDDALSLHRDLHRSWRNQSRFRELYKSKAYSVTLYRRWIEEDRAAGRDTTAYERALAHSLTQYTPRQIERARRKRER